MQADVFQIYKKCRDEFLLVQKYSWNMRLDISSSAVLPANKEIIKGFTKLTCYTSFWFSETSNDNKYEELSKTA